VDKGGERERVKYTARISECCLIGSDTQSESREMSSIYVTYRMLLWLYKLNKAGMMSNFNRKFHWFPNEIVLLNNNDQIRRDIGYRNKIIWDLNGLDV